MRRAFALAAVAAVLSSSCGWLKDPFEPWQVDIIYERQAAGVVANPTEVTVDAPFGFVILTNETDELRGFAMDGPAVYESIKPDATVRIRVEELRDGRTYAFYDHLHPGTIRGVLRTRFVAEEER